MNDIARLGIEVDSSSAARAVVDLDKLPPSAERAERSVGGLKDGFGKASEGAGAFAGALRLVIPLLTAAAGALSIGAIAKYADAWSDMQSRVGASIKNMEAAPALMGRIVDIANASYSPLAQTVEIYGRNVAVLRDLGRGATEAADFTEALNHALVTTATKGQDADVVLNALSRSIATGKLRTMEFETIMSRSPRVLEAVASEMGTTVTGLRNLAFQGKVTGNVIVDSLINSLEGLREEAGEMPATIGDAFTRIQTNTLALVGTLDQAWQVSGRVAEQILHLADGIRSAADVLLRMGNIVGSVVAPALTVMLAGIEAITPAATIAGAAVLGFFAGPMLIGGIVSATTAIVSGFVPALIAVTRGIQGITLAMMANPLGLLIGGMAAAITAAFLFRDQIKTAIGVDVVEVIKSAANSIIGAFKGAYDAVGILWGNFPDVMETIGNMMANKFIEAIEWMLNEASKKLNEWLGWAAKALGMFGPAMLAESLGGTNFGSVSITRRTVNPQGVQSIGAMRDAFTSAQEVDYLSGAATALREIWENGEGATQTLEELMAALDGQGGGGAGASGAGGAAAQLNAYQEATKVIQDQTRALQEQQLTFGLSEQAASTFTKAMELLRAAEEAKIPVTGALIEEINGLASAYALAEQNAKVLQEQQQLLNQASDRVASGLTSMFESAIKGGKDFGEVVTSLIGDLGRMFMNQGFQALLSGGLGGFNPLGFLGGLFGGAPSFAGGGYTGSGSRSGGLDGRGGFPAILHPNETVVDHSRGQAANQNMKVEIIVKVDGARGNTEIQQMVSQGVAQGMKTVERNFGGMLADHNMRNG